MSTASVKTQVFFGLMPVFLHSLMDRFMSFRAMPLFQVLGGQRFALS